MRNQYYLYGVLSAVILFGSCTDESKQFKTFSQKVLSFDTAEVTIEKDAVTRTWLVNSKDVIWSPSDDIGIFSDLTGFEGGQMYYITDDEMYTSGKMIFRGDEISGNQFYAYYPAYVSNPWEPDAENPEIIRYTMPKYVAFEQIPSSGGSISFGEPDYTPRTSLSKIPLVAKSADNNFVFKQTMGMLCFSLTGSMNVKKLILTGNNGELLYGDGYVDLSLDEPIFKIDEKSENVNDTIVFVEVKQRESLNNAAYAILPHQQERILRGARSYLQHHPQYRHCQMRFDAILIAFPWQIRHISNAWHI